MANLYGLPDIQFAEKDPAKIQDAIISGYEAAYTAATGERITLYPADPRRLFLLSIADIIALQRNIIDYTGKQNLLAYAEGSNLDHLGLLVDVPRQPAKYAKTTMKITLSAAQPGTTIYPQGTRVTPGGGSTYFAIVENLEIPAGELTGLVEAQALETGQQANGFLPGQINRLVDPLPYVKEVVNTTTSEGGADIEGDENLRDRIKLAPESYSNAGSRGAYEFWARSASQLIVDVGVQTPAPGEVNIYPLMINGELPGEEILNDVLKKCNDDTIRPMTDLVRALSPNAVTFDLYVVWYLDRANATQALSINIAVNKAVQDWLLWQRSALGRDINPSELTKRMVSAGAKRVVIDTPLFRVLQFNEVAISNNVEVIYGGTEDG